MGSREWRYIRSMVVREEDRKHYYCDNCGAECIPAGLVSMFNEADALFELDGEELCFSCLLEYTGAKIVK